MLKLRPAQTTDAPFMKELEATVMADHAKALWGTFRPVDHISVFDLESTRIIEWDTEVAGYVTVERAPDHLRLRKLYLSPAFQGKGIGKSILDQVRDEAFAAHLPLRLSVLRPNERALQFYLRERLELMDTTQERLFLQTPTPSQPSDPAL